MYTRGIQNLTAAIENMRGDLAVHEATLHNLLHEISGVYHDAHVYGNDALFHENMDNASDMHGRIAIARALCKEAKNKIDKAEERLKKMKKDQADSKAAESSEQVMVEHQYWLGQALALTRSGCMRSIETDHICAGCVAKVPSDEEITGPVFVLGESRAFPGHWWFFYGTVGLLREDELQPSIQSD